MSTRCGLGDCPGCREEDGGASRVVAVVPWERTDASFRARFFATAQATTGGAESFFLVLPDGSVGSALRFAVVAEILAVTSTAALLAPLAVLFVPGLLARFLGHGGTRATVALATLVGVIGFSWLLVAAHAVHGLALGGSTTTRSRALRIGLYGCGWDFASSPAGLLWAGVRNGAGAALRLLGASLTAPARAVDAALAGLQLDGATATRAKRRAMRVAMLVSVPAVMVILAAMAAVALLTTL